MRDHTSYLLNDDAMQRFIVEGYLQLQSDLSRDFHTRMYEELEPLDETGPRGHNNLLPCVPELRHILDEPKVVGALTSILGPDYYLHFHRHDHVNYPDGAQALHKDGDNHSHNAMDGLRRYHPTRFVMLLYYPQDTPTEMGPTGIVPRSQYVTRREVDRLSKQSGRIKTEIYQSFRSKLDKEAFRGTNRFQRYAEMEAEFEKNHPDLVTEINNTNAPWEAAKIALTGDAGTISIVHFDLVHGRYTANVAGKQRHMVKFLFARNEEPTLPTWRHSDTAWRGPENDPQAPIWKHIWCWHLGSGDANASKRNISELTEALLSKDDATAIGASYELGSTEEGLVPLFEYFFSDNLDLRAIAAYGIVRSAELALPELLSKLEIEDPEQQARILDLIGDMSLRAESAATTVASLAISQDVTVRRTAIEALGLVTQQHSTLDSQVIKALTDALSDDDALVIRNATFAIAKLGHKAGTDAIIDQLEKNLYHWHHHVRGWGIEALQRLRDPRAMQLVIRYLSSTRWDPAVKSGDRPVTRETMRETT